MPANVHTVPHRRFPAGARPYWRIQLYDAIDALDPDLGTIVHAVDGHTPPRASRKIAAGR